MNLSRLSFFFTLAIVFVACVMPRPAHAAPRALQDNASADFADSKPVGDKELSKMRGGMFNVDGLLISFGYNASTAVNGVTQSNVSFTDTDLVNNNPNVPNLSNGLPANIVQNAQNGALIQVQQQLNLTVSGATQAIQNRIPFAELGRMLH